MQFSTPSLLVAIAASASAYSPNARTFAVNHFYGRGPLVTARMDPIVSPGVASGHVHTVQGGNAFALTMNDTSALQSTCTSSLVKNDKSNYWTPSLYFQDPSTGILTSVPMFYMNVYYFFEATTDVIKAFPPGLRMVVGNPSLRTPPATGGKLIVDLSDGLAQPVQWTCPRLNETPPLYPPNSDGLHGVGIQDPGNGGSGVGFSDKNCDGYASPLRADVHFPSCYNPAAGLDNYRENMQFPTRGNCPSGWIHVPHLFYEVYWNTLLFADKWTPGQGKQPFVLSNGDPTGYSLHGDFLAGWDVATLQQVIDNCNSGTGGMDRCPGLMGGVNDPSTDCTVQSPINEVVTGDMQKLPGNNPIGQWGVAPSPPSAPSQSGAAIPPTVRQTTGASSRTASRSASSRSTPAATGGAGGHGAGAAIQDPSGVEEYSENLVAPSVTTTPAAEAQSPAEDQTTLSVSYVTTTASIYTTISGGAIPTESPSSPNELVPGWTYTGCYSDNLDNRVLSGITFANIGNHQVTCTKCIDYCDDNGYSMAGTEYGGQCFCGDELVGSSALDESQCNMPCDGDATETCGGSATLSVYSITQGSQQPSEKMMIKRHTVHMHQHQHIRGRSL